MIGWILLLLLTAVYFAKKYQNSLKWSHFPGESDFTSLPLLGHSYKLIKDPLGVFTDMQKKHGPMFRMDIGNIPTVFLCERDFISEACKLDAFNGRPYGEMPGISMIREKDPTGAMCGVSGTQGPTWKEHRKFMMTTLSDLGMGKRDTMEEVIGQETASLVNDLEEKARSSPNKTVRLKAKGLLFTFNNIIWRIATGATAGSDPEVVRDLSARVSTLFEALDPGSIFTLLQITSGWFAKAVEFIGHPNSILKNSGPMKDRCREEVAKHSPNKNGNYISRHKAKIEECQDPASIFGPARSKEQLFGGMFELFITGSDTISTFSEWSLVFMAAYPEVQERVVDEIESVVGRKGITTLEHKAEMNFTMATLEEISRLSPMLALSVAHAIQEDITFQGTFFPKGTQIMANQYACNRDPKLFENPLEFRPERYLDSKGKFKHTNNVSLFGIGKRSCVGEVLARAEMFMLFTNILSNFEISSSRGKERLLNEVIAGIMFYPKDMDLCLKIRDA